MDKTKEVLQSSTAGQVIVTVCGFGKYFAVSSLIVFVLSLTTGILNYSLLSKIAAAVFAVTQFLAWRIYLDKFLFQILYADENKSEDFDTALHFLFNCRNHGKTLAERWHGTKRLLALLGCGLLIQILFLLVGLS